jgi:hypothetical protein
MYEKFILNGTWGNSIFKLVIKGNAYVSFVNGRFCYRYGKGTFVYDNENFTLRSTHARKLFFWTPFVEEVKGNYILTGDEVSVSNIEGRYESSNGKWVQIKGKWNLKRCSK